MDRNVVIQGRKSKPKTGALSTANQSIKRIIAKQMTLNLTISKILFEGDFLKPS